MDTTEERNSDLEDKFVKERKSRLKHGKQESMGSRNDSKRYIRHDRKV